MSYCDKSILTPYCSDSTCKMCTKPVFDFDHKHEIRRDRNPAECRTCGKTEIELWHISGEPEMIRLVENFFEGKNHFETGNYINGETDCYCYQKDLLLNREHLKILAKKCFLLGKKFS